MNICFSSTLICLLSLSLNSLICDDSLKKEKSAKNYIYNQVSSNLKFKSADSLVCKSYTLRFETTYLKDSVSSEERHLFKPVVISQRLIFLKDGKILKIKSNLSRKIYQKVQNGHKIVMLSTVYYKAYIVTGKYKTVIAVDGSGGCNSCPETLDFYTLSGDLAYKDGSSHGWRHFLKEYGIVNYNKSDNEVHVYPPRGN
jgi:hypothetical protein